MKPDWHLKLPGGSTAWWETAQEGRPPPLKRLTLPQHTCALIRTDPHPGARLNHCSIIPFAPLYQKEKERETKEEGSEGRRWVQIALLLWLPSCAFQVLWPSFKDKELKLTSPPSSQNSGGKNESFSPSCRMWRTINYGGQEVTWSQERLSTVQVQTSAYGMSMGVKHTSSTPGWVVFFLFVFLRNLIFFVFKCLKGKHRQVEWNSDLYFCQRATPWMEKLIKLTLSCWTQSTVLTK